MCFFSSTVKLPRCISIHVSDFSKSLRRYSSISRFVNGSWLHGVRLSFLTSVSMQQNKWDASRSLRFNQDAQREDGLFLHEFSFNKVNIMQRKLFFPIKKRLIVFKYSSLKTFRLNLILDIAVGFWVGFFYSRSSFGKEQISTRLIVSIGCIQTTAISGSSKWYKNIQAARNSLWKC